MSVVTTTWNRRHYVERVWQGLAKQTSFDFEWIVADDGSTDDTASLIELLAAKSPFPIIYLRADAHVGKVRMDNEAISRSSGQLMVHCDSDDVLTPIAVERILSAWSSIDDEDDYIGVTALAETADGLTTDPLQGITDITWNQLASQFPTLGDMVYAVRTDAMKANPFPDVDFVVPESIVWNAIGDQKTRFVPEVLKRIEYRTPGAISFSGVMAYNRGRAYALAACRNELGVKRNLMPLRFMLAVTFLRYCWHGDIGLREAFHLWGHSPFQLLSAIPLSAVFVARDLLLKDIVKTHHEHARNRGANVAVRSFDPSTSC